MAAITPDKQRVLLRVAPGVDAGTHASVAAGGEDQKFGFALSSGAAADAVARVLRQPELELTGLHCHLGSQITGLPVYELAARRLIALMAAVHAEHGLALPELNLGGGHAVPYTDGDPEFDLQGFAGRIRRVIRDECAWFRLPVPRLIVEPGRAIISRAMVTVYRVVGIKQTPGGPTFVAVDGGMSDNPRPVLYGARYAMYLARRSSAPAHPVTVVGRHCEPGDVLAHDALLPADIGPATCSPCPAPARIPSRWRPTTAWPGDRRWWPSGTAPPGCCCAGKPPRTCCAATSGGDQDRSHARPEPAGPVPGPQLKPPDRRLLIVPVASRPGRLPGPADRGGCHRDSGPAWPSRQRPRCARCWARGSGGYS